MNPFPDLTKAQIAAELGFIPYLLYVADTGSVNQRLNDIPSDYDFVAIIVPPLNRIIEDSPFLGKEIHGIASGIHSIDLRIYSLGHFVSLLRDNNPTVVESLFSNEDCQLYVDAAFAEFVVRRKEFVSQQLVRIVHRMAQSFFMQATTEPYSPKMMCHAIRLCMCSVELSEHHRFIYPERYTQLLKDVKFGAMSREKAIEEYTNHKAIAYAAHNNTQLQAATDIFAIDDIAARCFMACMKMKLDRGSI